MLVIKIKTADFGSCSVASVIATAVLSDAVFAIDCYCKPSILSYRLHIARHLDLALILLLFLAVELRLVTGAITGVVYRGRYTPDDTDDVLLAVDGPEFMPLGLNLSLAKSFYGFRLSNVHNSGPVKLCRQMTIHRNS